jgi:SAM-dependent methyltransferase
MVQTANIATKFRIANALHASFKKLRPSDSYVNPEHLLSLRLKVKAGISPNYKSEAEAFAHLYFWKNFKKAAQGARHLHLESGKAIRILDLGSGSGASACGILEGLSQSIPNVGRVELVCVDDSPSQNQLFRQIALPVLSDQEIGVEIIEQDARQFLRTCRTHFDLVLISFLLIELSEVERREVLALTADTVRFGNRLIIDKDLSGESVARYSNGSGIPVRIPSRPILQSKLPWLLHQYFTAWERHDCKLVCRIFNDSATYQIRPSKVLYGIDEIVQYWKRNANEQTNVLWQVISFSEFKDVITAEWKCSFSRNGESYCLDGFLTIHHLNSKIIKFEEAYLKRTDMASLLPLP